MTSNLPLEDVLHEVIRSEAEPDYSAMTRWCGLFPHYREDLQHFFATWHLQDFYAGLRTRSGEAPPLATEAKQHALEVMRTLGRIPTADKVAPLGKLERLVLAAIVGLQGRGILEDIITRIPEMMGARVLPAAILTIVKGLENAVSLPDRYRIATATRPDTGRRAHSASPWRAYALSGFRMLVPHQDPKAQPLRLNRTRR